MVSASEKGEQMKTTMDFKNMKAVEKIAMITAYDFPSAKLAQSAGVDLILVGDSVGMVALGYDSTVPVTVEDMILHTKAVKRGAKETFVVTDMPFMSYHVSVEQAMNNAQRLIQEGGAHALKLEGAGKVLPIIKQLTLAGVPVVAHLGLTPQSVGVLGGYKVQGKSEEQARKLIEDSKAAEEAGACMLVLECVPKQLAEKITGELSIPTIGIGAGAGTDGQVLVYHDLIGYGSGRVPKFVKQYTTVSSSISEAINEYVTEVKQARFPESRHTFTMDDEVLEQLYGGHKDENHNKDK
jgi:3-methyl-2-oxobutanoate hydroxymethyltransferase